MNKNEIQALNTAAFLHMDENDSGYKKARENFSDACWNYFSWCMRAQRKNPTEEKYCEAFNESLLNCTQRFDASRNILFTTYFYNDFSKRIQTKIQRQYTKAVPCPASRGGYFTDEISPEDYLDYAAYQSGEEGGLCDFSDDPHSEYIEAESCLNMLDKVNECFFSLQNRTRPVVAAFLTNRFYHALYNKDIIGMKLAARPFFNREIFDRCRELGRPMSQREVADYLQIYESNYSRIVKNYQNKVLDMLRNDSDFRLCA